MELRRYLWLIRQYILLIVVTTAVGAAVGYATTSSTKLYTTTATVYVGPRDLASNPQANYGVTGLDQILYTYAQMIPSGVVGQAAVSLTHVPRTAGEAAAETHATVVMATATTSTDIIDVTVTDPDPAVAQKLADGMAEAFTAQVGRNGSSALPSEPASVFQYAGYPGAPLPEHHAKRTGIGAAAGLVLAVLAVLLLDYLDTSVRSGEDVEAQLGVPVLGVVPRARRLAGPAGSAGA